MPVGEKSDYPQQRYEQSYLLLPGVLPPEEVEEGPPPTADLTLLGLAGAWVLSPQGVLGSNGVGALQGGFQGHPANVVHGEGLNALVGGQQVAYAGVTGSGIVAAAVDQEVFTPDIGAIIHANAAGAGLPTFREAAATTKEANVTPASAVTGPYNGTRTGTVTSVTSIVKAADNTRGAYDFDGTTGRAAVPNSAAYERLTAVSVGCWINFDTLSAGNHPHILCLPSGAGWSSPFLRLRLSVVTPGRVTFAVNDASNDVTGATTLTLGVTYHIVGTWDGSNIRVYVNGVLDGTAAYVGGAITTSGRPLSIGTRSSTDTGAEWVDGRVEELALWGRALTGPEITTWYNEQDPGGGGSKRRLSSEWFTAFRTNLIACWHMHDRSDHTDTSELARVLTKAGGVTLSATSKFGANALDFDGVDGVAWFENDRALRLVHGMGIDLQLDPDTVAAAQIIAEHARDAGTRWTWDITAAGRMRWTYRSGGVTILQIDDGGGLLATGAYQHIAWDYDAQAEMVYLYRNGVIVASGALDPADVVLIDGPLSFGSDRLRGGALHLDGRLDEIRLAQYHHLYGGVAFTAPTAAYPDP